MNTDRVLVTGGAGFIGSAYVRALLAPGAAPEGEPAPHGVAPEAPYVTVLDALTYAASPARLDAVRAHPRFRFVHGDVCDAALVDRLAAGHTHIVHLAAESHVDRSIADGTAFARTNVLGTQTLLEAAVRHGVRVFVQVSTDEVYGSVPRGAATETHPLDPSSPYAASKAAADLLALSYHRTHGLDVRVTRCSNNHGPYQHPEKAVPRFLTALLTGGTVPIYGDGRQVRDWLHVEDHVAALELVRRAGRPGRVYNIGGGTSLTTLDLAHRLAALCDADPALIAHTADRKGHDRRYAIDHTRISTELGYHPRHTTPAALAETAHWYATHPAWWRPLLAAAPDRP
jgi:dTDP-glucose 4,6-dehydratase